MRRSRLPQSLVDFIKSEEGPSAVEYAVLTALVIVVCLGAISVLGTNSNKTFTTAARAAGRSG